MSVKWLWKKVLKDDVKKYKKTSLGIEALLGRGAIAGDLSEKRRGDDSPQVGEPFSTVSIGVHLYQASP